MARSDPQFNLRVPIELKQKVEGAAKESGRSINAEAVYRLEKSFDAPVSLNSTDAEMMTKIVASSMKKLIDELKNEGVESDKLASAIHNVANK
ncbi:Arc family DNA-binding protein [Acinetobacter pollinis]|uniref:Arc family DNA-binding protein n=1 Tax=Acinetobacter pollinis TaxID=2605270 RepID=A0ABU6DQ51_9GAMM|nr:Arc family DNA-binding protein [Acinetobacter pollinis]MBF7694149.1 Arc family DNA-binding protein [Acinetobacter pollinis]MBF7701739.1 Arc family DNA-binding protein [Acinetobacter pollinis]MEB5475992.1 Arc family DNA-binding protein [Acinetobacter pollinis]